MTTPYDRYELEQNIAAVGETLAPHVVDAVRAVQGVGVQRSPGVELVQAFVGGAAARP